MAQLTLYLSDALIDRLKREAQATGIKLSKLASTALETYLGGRHLTQEEYVRALQAVWNSYEPGHDVEIPEDAPPQEREPLL
ncbi:MAG: hypothetical protein LBS72_02215 [Oscillospiraceae bacterium]|nr:hypothetical protein [Oscillospiraceae bacterium]